MSKETISENVYEQYMDAANALIMEQYLNGSLSEASEKRAAEIQAKRIKYGDYVR